jgi:hypothetical protein
MPVTTQQILTDEDATRYEIETRSQQLTAVREAFRDAGSVPDAETVYFVVPEDDAEEMSIVPEGSEFPRAAEGQRKVPCVREKFGEEFPLTMEAQMDEMVDNQAENLEGKIRAYNRTQERYAHDVLDDAAEDFDPDESDGTLDYEDIVDGMTEMMERQEGEGGGWTADTIITGPSGFGDIAKSDRFTQATEQGEETIREGFVGNIFGIPMYLTNQVQIDPGTAYLVDSTSFGYEATWQDTDTRTYEEENKQTDVLQFWSLKGYCAVRESAALHLQG